MTQRSDEITVSIETMLDALGSRLRRQVLATLVEREPRDERGLAEAFCEGDEIGPLRIRLRHAELPRLDAMGFVDWNPESGTVARGPAFDSIRPLLAALRRRGDESADDLR